LAAADLPFGNDNLDVLISKFDKKGLNAKEMVALSGKYELKCIY
jgi:Peroxidase